MPAFPTIQIVMPPADQWQGWRFRCSFDESDNSRSLIFDKKDGPTIVIGKMFLDDAITIELVQTPSAKELIS